MPLPRKQSLSHKQCLMRERQREVQTTQAAITPMVKAPSPDHYWSIPEIAKKLNTTRAHAGRIFKGRPGVKDIGMGKKKAYLRVPDEVLQAFLRGEDRPAPKEMGSPASPPGEPGCFLGAS